MLQVPIFTPNVMVCGDSGRYELRINVVLLSIKEWIRKLNKYFTENSINVRIENIKKNLELIRPDLHLTYLKRYGMITFITT